MKAIVHHRYGSSDVLELQEVDKPSVKDDQVLIRVHAASVNPYDWHMMTGTPYLVRAQAGLRKPKSKIPGVDVAGTVEAVGSDITEFQPGDDIFGAGRGAYAEYATATERGIALKPAGVAHEHAAAVPMAAVTALQGLRNKGNLQPGQEVLINGASGGVGSFAVQIAKSLGADVTAVCSTRNVDMVRSIGADHVIDYTQEDFTKMGVRYDLVLDVVGNHSLSACRRALRPTGIYVSAGKKPMGQWVGPLTHLLKVLGASWFGKPKMVSMLASFNKEDMVVLQGLLEAGTITPVIDRTYKLDEVPEALRYQGEGHAQGKTVITIR